MCRSERCRIRALGIEHGLFVLLQIFVVAAGQPLHRRQPAGEPANRPAGLAAYELQRIGVFLLRHHAAAGSRRVGQIEEAVFLAGEDDEVLGDPAQMHHPKRDRIQKRCDEITIGRGVHAVRHDARKTERACEQIRVDAVTRTGDRA